MYICHDGIGERLLGEGEPFYLAVEHYRTFKVLQGYTEQEEAELLMANRRKECVVLKSKLLKVIPAEQRWEALEEYERETTDENSPVG